MAHGRADLSEWLHLRPLIPALSAFILGIFFSSRTDLSTTFFLFLFALSLLTCLALVLLKLKGALHSTFISFFFLGALFITPYARPDMLSDHIVLLVAEHSERGAVVDGTVVGVPEKSSDGVRFYLDAGRVTIDDKTRPASGLVRVTIGKNDGDALQIGPGDFVRARAKLSRPRNLSNPGGFDYEWWLGRRGVYVAGYVKTPAHVKILEPARGPRKLLWTLRERVEGEIRSSGLKHSAMITALVTGARGDVSPELEEAFRRTGTTHILSISGLHVGVVAWTFYVAMLSALRRSKRLMLAMNVKRLSLALALGPVFFYSALSGFSVSTERAAIMVAAFVAVQFMGRGRDMASAVALAALVILAKTPWALWEPSFQLSFSAVIGMAAIVPALERLFERETDPLDAITPKGLLGRVGGRLGRYAGALFLTSLAASLATAPITAFHFNGFSLSGLIANVAAVPLMGFGAVVLSLAGTALIPLGHGLCHAAFFGADALIEITAAVVSFLSSFDFAFTRTKSPEQAFIILYYLFLSSMIFLRRDMKLALASGAVVVIAGASFYVYDINSAENGVLRATVLSVGQSEATLVEFPTGETMLIDGGGSLSADFDVGERVIAPHLWNRGIDHLDFLVLSHAQRDHMGGLTFVAENFEIGEFWWPGMGDLKTLGAALKNNDISAHAMGSSSNRRDIGKASVEFLGPRPGDTNDLNDASLVLKIAYGRRSFLFTGDVGAKAEAALLAAYGEKLSADFLKAPHHGSRYSSSREFLKAVSPSIIAVSAGFDNGFGFPHAETLGRYDEIKADVFRTDLDGAVMIKTDGETITAEAHLTDGRSRSILEIRTEGGENI
jgi:competence protein ComEC